MLSEIIKGICKGGEGGGGGGRGALFSWHIFISTDCGVENLKSTLTFTVIARTAAGPHGLKLKGLIRSLRLGLMLGGWRPSLKNHRSR